MESRFWLQRIIDIKKEMTKLEKNGEYEAILDITTGIQLYKGISELANSVGEEVTYTDYTEESIKASFVFNGVEVMQLISKECTR